MQNPDNVDPWDLKVMALEKEETSKMHRYHLRHGNVRSSLIYRGRCREVRGAADWRDLAPAFWARTLEVSGAAVPPCCTAVWAAGVAELVVWPGGRTQRRLDSGGDRIVARAWRHGGGGREDWSKNWHGGALTGCRWYSGLPGVGHLRDS
ncbi:hypothetical protein NDU88_000713 [Pleurodeles waltl]|uniref:Uncharacterized protein n=1 Tax=Pleurodeles waltl TaxID=8319 RepID=A0AAV7Q3Y0_PLEWA|nr:hypothetical protein NDU88_000713 [Pleurodeles waltl]